MMNDADVTVIHADIRGAIDVLIDVGIDAMIVDPPYADRVHDKATSNGTDGAGVVDRDLGFGAIDEELRAAIAKLAAHVARWSIVFSDIESAHIWRSSVENAGAQYLRSVPWVRWSQPQLSGDRPPSGCELVTIAHRRAAKHWSGPGSLTAFEAKALRGRDKFSCEKPLDLMLSLVSWFSDHGELVCDPCAGSGTTGLACRLLGRRGLLLDCDEGAVARAEKKVASPISDRDLERCARWVEYQRGWLDAGAPSTKAGAARYARAEADTRRIERILGG